MKKIRTRTTKVMSTLMRKKLNKN